MPHLNSAQKKATIASAHDENAATEAAEHNSCCAKSQLPTCVSTLACVADAENRQRCAAGVQRRKVHIPPCAATAAAAVAPPHECPMTAILSMSRRPLKADVGEVRPDRLRPEISAPAKRATKQRGYDNLSNKPSACTVPANARWIATALSGRSYGQN